MTGLRVTVLTVPSPVFVFGPAAALCCCTMRVTATLLTGLMMCAAATSLAATYRWVDADGVVHYADTPHQGAEKIDLPSAQTYGAPPAPSVKLSPTRTKDQSPTAYQSCVIAAPGNDEVLFEQNSVQVAVTLNPAMRPGDHLELTMDGVAITPSSSQGTAFQISPIDRGTHTLNAIVRAASNAAVCTAQPVTFHVRQPSVLAPNSPLKK